MSELVENPIPQHQKENETGSDEDGIRIHLGGMQSSKERYLPGEFMKLQRALDLVGTESVDNALCTYEKYTALIECRFPNMDPMAKADWSIAAALSPTWFSDSLTTRMNNTMLVSALLITVTAQYFLSPPSTMDTNGDAYSAFYFICGLCNLLFMISITFGVIYIENAMSRAFCESERFALIMSQYVVKNVAQTTMVIGALLFPIMIAIPMYSTYSQSDSTIGWVFVGVVFLLILVAQLFCARQAAMEQYRRIQVITEFQWTSISSFRASTHSVVHKHNVLLLPYSCSAFTSLHGYRCKFPNFHQSNAISFRLMCRGCSQHCSYHCCCDWCVSSVLCRCFALPSLQLIVPFVDDKCRLLPKYRPPSAPFTFEEWKEFFKVEVADSKSKSFIIYNN